MLSYILWYNWTDQIGRVNKLFAHWLAWRDMQIFRSSWNLSACVEDVIEVYSARSLKSARMNNSISFWCTLTIK